MLEFAMENPIVTLIMLIAIGVSVESCLRLIFGGKDGY